jgi:ATP-dependent protease ClpP protease subunit
MKLTERIVAEEGRETLQKLIAELEEENSWMNATAVKLQGSVDSSVETMTTL